MMITKPNPLPAETLANIGLEPAEPGAPPLNAQREAALHEALEDLENLEEDAHEEGLPPPSKIAKDKAREFLQETVRKAPLCYSVSPWDEGEVIVYTQDKKGFRVSVYFNAKGGASCYVTRPEGIGNKNRHFPQINETAIKWIFDALQKLDK